jgi:hypothetical protein
MAKHLGPSSILDDVARSPWARTLWQGLIVDALAAVGLGLTLLLATGDITSPAFWSAFGVLVGKSFLTALASYLTRLKAPQEDEPLA